MTKKHRGCKFFRFWSKFGPSPSRHDFQLRCLFEGKAATFIVIASGETDISKLKEFIHMKGINPASSSIKAKDLVLLKVKNVLRTAVNIWAHMLCFARLTSISVFAVGVLSCTSLTKRNLRGLKD